MSQLINSRVIGWGDGAMHLCVVKVRLDAGEHWGAEKGKAGVRSGWGQEGIREFRF